MNSAPRYEILSYPINAATPMYGSAPGPVLIPFSQIANGDTSNSYTISLFNHTGTHIDAPRHFVDKGKLITGYALDELIFNHPAIVDCPKEGAELISRDDLRTVSYQLQMSDCLLLRTGFGRFRNEKRYRTDNPGIAPETIRWIREEYPSIRCIGIDSISISSFQYRNEGREAHRAAFVEKTGFGKPLLLIEDMKLDIVTQERLCTLIVLPWQIDGVDSAPCNIIAILR
ncbi:MAG: cyclase family protein [Candidatus Methanoperedens sp.]|nr:cyclase family protein [Candidatus Methanoperedens sp.]